MDKLIKIILFVFTLILSFNVSAVKNKLGGMVVFPNKDKIFSAIVYLDDKIMLDDLKVSNGYSMDYYRYGLEHSNVLPLLDFTVKQDNNNSNYLYIKSLKPVNRSFDLVLRVTSAKEDILSVYKVENSNKINYFPNELNEKTKQEEEKNTTLKIATSIFSEFNQTPNNLDYNAKHMLAEVNEVPVEKIAVDINADEKNQSVKQEIISNRYCVVKGDNITKIAARFSYMFAGDGLNTVINKIYQTNKHAFINNNINKIKTGACLVLPFDNQYSEEVYALEKRYNEQEKICVIDFEKTKEVLFENNLYKQDSENKNNQKSYKVVKGDCLSKIAYGLKERYPNIRWKKIMDIIYQNNKSAFIRSDINLVKADAVLHINDEYFIH